MPLRALLPLLATLLALVQGPQHALMMTLHALPGTGQVVAGHHEQHHERTQHAQPQRTDHDNQHSIRDCTCCTPGPLDLPRAVRLPHDTTNSDRYTQTEPHLGFTRTSRPQARDPPFSLWPA